MDLKEFLAHFNVKKGDRPEPIEGWIITTPYVYYECNGMAQAQKVWIFKAKIEESRNGVETLLIWISTEKPNHFGLYERAERVVVDNTHLLFFSEKEAKLHCDQYNFANREELVKMYESVVRNCEKEITHYEESISQYDKKIEAQLDKIAALKKLKTPKKNKTKK